MITVNFNKMFYLVFSIHTHVNEVDINTNMFYLVHINFNK